MEAANKEKSLLQNSFNEQLKVAAQLEKLTSEKTILDDQYATIRAKKEAVEKVVFEREMQIARKLEDVERALLDYNNLCREKKLSPSNAKYADGVEFQLVHNAIAPEEILDQLKNIIKVDIVIFDRQPALEQKKENFSRNGTSLKEESLELATKTSNCLTEIMDKKETVESLALETKKTEATNLRQIEQMKGLLKQKQFDVDSTIQETNRLRDLSHDTLYQSNAKYESLVREYNAFVEKAKKDKEVSGNHLLSIADEVIKHLQFVGESLGAISTTYEQTKEKLSVRM